MAHSASSPQPDAVADAWRELDRQLHEMSRLASGELSPVEFYGELVNRVVRTLAAVGGSLWLRADDGSLRQIAHAGWSLSQTDATAAQRQSHVELLGAVMRLGGSQLLTPRQGLAGIAGAVNTTPFPLALSPWRLADGTEGLLELFQRPDTSLQSQQGCLHFLAAAAEQIADFHRQRELREVRDQLGDVSRQLDCLQRIHASLDLDTTVYRIVNEVRQLLGCDRVSLVEQRGGKSRVLAVSGVERLESRGSTVQLLAQLSREATATGQPLWYAVGAGDSPFAAEEILAAYLDASHASQLAILPLVVSTEPPAEAVEEVLGALVLESFGGTWEQPLRSLAYRMQPHVALALHNAQTLRRLPFGRLLQAVGRSRVILTAQRLPRTLLYLLATMVVAAVLLVVPADFTIRAPGELQPIMRRDVFAPADGVVMDVSVKHADRVQAGQTLAELQRPELDFESRRVWGELQTAQQRLSAAEIERLQHSPSGEEGRRGDSQRTAEAEELRELIASLEQRQVLLEQQQAELRVPSPMRGEVLTWNLEQRLQARPVQRGQVLLTVADLKGPWCLELRVPEDRISDLLAARKELGPAQFVSFVLATDPRTMGRGRIRQVAVRAEVDDADNGYLLVIADIDREQVFQQVPGASVYARIYCGRRPLGFVWFHDLFRAIRLWWLS